MGYVGKDYIGKTYGRLTILKQVQGVPYKKNKTSRVFLCECSCGKKKEIYLTALLRGYTKSCGCFKREGCIVNFGDTRPKRSKDSWQQRLFKKHKRDCGSRRKTTSLTIDQFSLLITQNCFYCGVEPNNNFRFLSDGQNKSIVYTHHKYQGIDRVDSTTGYLFENCVPCCAFCNRAKGELTQDDFISRIKRIYECRITKQQ